MNDDISSKDNQSTSANRVGLGVDLVEISRMRKIINRTPSFKKRYFTEAEQDYCDSRSDPAKAYAVRFAAKEAAVKALGTGFSHGVVPKDIEVIRNSEGRPSVMLRGAAQLTFEELGMKELALSLSHTDTDAVACVVAISHESDDRAILKMDPAAELANQFKQARAFLDEI